MGDAATMTADAVAALGGLVPVTRSSGKYRGVNFVGMYLTPAGRCHRYRRRQSARSLWAQIFTDAPCRRHGHQHAVRILARALSRLSGAASAPALPTTVRFTTARRNPRHGERPEFAAKGGYSGVMGHRRWPGDARPACLAP